MVDNIELIKPLLKFESKDDFYYLQILQRKKENKTLNSNSRVIKNYYIKSLEYLELRYPEIKELCNHFNARASLRLNKRSFEKVAFKALQNMTNTMMSRDYDYMNKAYDRACGQSHNEKDKKWILDIDYNIEPIEGDVLRASLRLIEPYGDKILAEIPSKSGWHFITKPFNTLDSKYLMEKFDIDIQKDNPTNLYIK